MWVRDNKVWYEAELIEKIKAICKEQTETRMLLSDKKSFCDFCKILDLIKSYEGGKMNFDEMTEWIKNQKSKYMQVTQTAIEKSGYSAVDIYSRYESAHLGFDGTFTLGTNLFGIDKQRINSAIIWLGNVPIEWYEEDIKREEEERIRKAKMIADRERRLYYAGREGTKTERKRDKRASENIARNCK